MDILIHFKTPDAVDHALDGLTPEQKRAALEAIRKWVEFGECVTVEIDTETGEACVVPVR